MDAPFRLGPSRGRLNRIAERKLRHLGISVDLSADGGRLGGSLSFAERQVRHPMTGAPITGARFVVQGHDKLRFVEPPLSALAPVAFHDLERAEAIGERVVVWLRVRMGFLKDAAGRLKAFGLSTREDPERLLVLSEVRTEGHLFEIAGGPDGLRVTRVVPPEGRTFAVSGDYPPLALDEHSDLSELELFLISELPAMRRPRSRAAAPGEPGELALVAPPDGALLAAFFNRFGPEAQVSVAPGGTIQICQELELGGVRYRFTAVHDEGVRFLGTLEEDGRERWSDHFDIHRFPGIYELTRTLLELKPAAVSREPEVVAELGVPAIPSHLTPHDGEVWVMSVLVEGEERSEVRYSCLDVHGQPYGATRVLAREVFEDVFARHRAGWRLLVRVEQVQGQHVIYRQLDARRQPRGAPKAVRIENLLANFVPEAEQA